MTTYVDVLKQKQARYWSNSSTHKKIVVRDGSPIIWLVVDQAKAPISFEACTAVCTTLYE